MWEWIKRLFGWRPEPTAPAPTPAPIPEAPKPAPIPPPLKPKDQIPPAEYPNTAGRVLGLDVAKYQDKLDQGELNRLYQMGYRFIFAKATDGGAGVDPYFKTHRKNAKETGFTLGAYHFFRFGVQGQARHMLNTVGGWLYGELPPVLDVEWDRFGPLKHRYGTGKRMDAAAVDMVYECVREMEGLFGVKPIIYTNAYFWPEKIEKPERFQGYLCWIPSYSDSLNPRGVHHLADLSPAELAQAGKGVKVPYPWKQWNFWQDDDDLAIGDVKAIDTNVFRGSLQDLKALTKKA